MGFYKNPEEMYTARAERFRRDGNTHWAQAKNGEGGYHYTQARFCYEEAAKNATKAEQARADNAVFRSGRKKGGR